MYKKALNSFFLKVHPDFFATNATQQRANEGSIARLNELLSWAKDFKNGAPRLPPNAPSGGGATISTFTFYLKSDSDAPIAAASGRRAAAIPPVSATFELPRGFAATDSNRGVVERAVNRFLRDLLRRAECIDAATEAISVADDRTRQSAEALDAAAASTAADGDDPGAAQERFRQEARPLRRRARPTRASATGDRNDQERGPQSLLDEATETLAERWQLTPAPTLEELFDADQVFFSRDLSPLQSAAALETIRAHLPDMQYDRWQSMPLLIVPAQQFGIGDVASGTLTVPWDFTLGQFLAFLDQNDAAIAASRRRVEDFARSVETLIAETCNALELDDILISCSHTAAHPCLQLLHRNTDLLLFHNVTKTTLEIGDRFAVRANGVVIVPCHMTMESLREWLPKIQPRMPLQQRSFALSKQMLETTMYYLKEFRSCVEPKGIDAFDSNELTYAERLSWAKELMRIGPALAQWDWSDFTFAIGPLDINWEGRLLTLPHNFDGTGLLRYIEDVHSGAKQRHREALVAQSNAAREEAESGRRSAENLDALAEQERAKDATVAATAAAKPPAGVEKATAAALRDARATLRGSEDSAYLQEYMTSRPDVIEPLRVEPPLQHRTTFASEDEAKDQLKWEGFYDDPTVDVIPASVEDDSAHAFAATNRWHREAAVKKMLEEIQGKYGTGRARSKRFDHLKMGDLLGINDPKVKPRGFPVLAKGTTSARAA